MLLVEINYPIKTEIKNKANLDKVNIYLCFAFILLSPSTQKPLSLYPNYL
jgi:hypothetical protein